MVYNNVTNTLRNWCNEMTEHYADLYLQERARTGQSVRFLSYHVTAELSYKLGTVVDKYYPSFEAYRNAVLDLVSLRIDCILSKKFDENEASYIRSAESAFRDYLDTVSPDCPSPKMPYDRIIWGTEADSIAEQFMKVWQYDTNYWYPLNGMADEDKLFIHPKRLKPYFDQINQLVGLPQNRIYRYGEAWYDRPHCAEVDKLEDFSGCEMAYCPKDFSWIIYYSHEYTVTFAGSILPQIKEILSAEQVYWNRFDEIGCE